MSEIVEQHIPCPCGKSSDAYCTYDDDHGHCFSCGKTFPGDGGEPGERQEKSNPDLIHDGEFRSLPSRNLTEDICRKYGYFVGYDDRGKKVQVAPYRNQKGRVVGQKIRGPNKKIWSTGEMKGVQLFGQHLWKKGGKRLVITEGEIDALSAAQMLGSWPAVSIPKGAKGAVKAIKENLEFIESYEKVLICFDQDEEGEAATEEVCRILSPGKAYVMELPEKDASEMLQANMVKEFVHCMWEAQEYRPDGLVTLDDVFEDAIKPVEWGLSWVYDKLTTLTYGRRFGEIYALGAGTGIGKTDFFTEQMAYDVNELGEEIGIIALEQLPKETAKRLAGKIAGRRFHVPDAAWTNDELREALEKLRGKVNFYDNWGQTDWDPVKAHIRHLAVSRGVRIFYLDHLTAMADPSQEKESLEQIMKEMAGLANELSIIIHFVSHLATPEGKPHEEGGRVTIRHFKGSRAIGFWSFFMFGMERNQQDKDPETRQTTTFRVLKDRYTGQGTGEVFYLKYDADTGRLYESSPPNGEEADFEIEDDGEDY